MKTIDLSMVAVLEEKVKALENIDSTHEHPVTHGHTKPLINAKEIELLKSKKIVDLQKKISEKEEFAEKLANEIVLVEK